MTFFVLTGRGNPAVKRAARKSRKPTICAGSLIASLVAFAAPTAAQTNNDPMTKYRSMTGVTASASCSSKGATDDLVVCGRRDDGRYRLGAIDGDDAGPQGSVRDTRSDMLREGSKCSGGGVGAHGNAGCGGGLNVLAIGAAAVKAVKAIID